MAVPVSAVLFDLDGTLVDTAPDFVRIVQKLSQEDGKISPSESDIREQVSAGARAMVRLMIDSDDECEIEDYRQRFLLAYEANICVDSSVFTPLDRLLDDLQAQGILWGIVTNKPRHLSEQLLAALNLKTKCHVLVCPDDVCNTKPSPEPLFLACQILDVDPKTCIYIGDHIRDIQAGNAAGMTTVAAAFGYLSAQDKCNLERWQADVIVQSPDELMRYVMACYR